LHYTMIYLLDFFSRTWLTHEHNRYHGLTLLDGKQETIAIEKSGGFQRAVDAFYVLNKSSLFSIDDDSWITYGIGDTQPIRIEKMKYCDAPQLILRDFVETYNKLTNIEKYSKITKIGYQTNNANPILVSFVILHGLISISRYRAGEWLEICSRPALMNDYEILQHDILNVRMPDIFRETILKRNLDWSAIG
jgi:hypothetical protein